ncbi:MAG: hypothetical protein KF703_01835 [Actinobacteria bacterium]|nr:hypothetical protein [Actinomycetota bacterium]
MSRPLVTAAAVLVALTSVVGCSSSDGSDGAAPKTTTTEQGASDRSTTTQAGDDAPDTTEGGDAPDTTTGGGGGGGGGDVELSGDFCAKAKQLEGMSDDIFGDTTSDTSPDALLASLKQLFRSLDSLYGQLQDDAPAAIADDLDVLAEFASSNYEKIQDMDSYEDAAKLAQSAFSGDADSEEFRAASDRIGAYVEKECGLTTG